MSILLRTAALVAGLVTFGLVTTGCDSASVSGIPMLAGSDARDPASSGDPAPSGRSWVTDVLVFNGNGVWTSEVNGIQSILATHGLSYRLVSSAQLNAMTADDLDDYGMILWPGGSGTQQAASVSTSERAALREAVNNRGVGFLGFCAGAFMVVDPLFVVDHPTLNYYYLENQGTDIAMTLWSFPDGSTRDVLWYGGPVTPDYSGGVIARYPTGEPAVTQTWAGKGFVIMSGGHPTVSEATKTGLGLRDSDGSDQVFAGSLVEAVLHQRALQVF